MANESSTYLTTRRSRSMTGVWTSLAGTVNLTAQFRESRANKQRQVGKAASMGRWGI